MRRAARFINNDSLKEMNSIDITQTHAVRFMKTYNNKSMTENGAVGYKTTTHPLLDLNFKVSSLRNRDEKYIVDAFVAAFYQNRKYAVKWLFFLRDIFRGIG